MVKRGGWFAIVLCGALLLAGCEAAPPEEVVIPTVMDLNAISTDAAATDAANTATATMMTATAAAVLPPTREPLPPTWTPSPEPSPLPTTTSVGAVAAPASVASGTIYYVFNGNTIAYIGADAQGEGVLPIPQTGQPIADLNGSPDGTRLAYVSPVGTAQEIFVTDRVGAAQQVTRLGFARVFLPTWRPDGGALAFLASQALNSPLDVFMVNLDGSGQRQVTQQSSPDMSGLSWNAAGDTVFFNDRGTIFGVNPATGVVTPFAPVQGIGPYFAPTHNPVTADLLFLRLEVDTVSGQVGHYIHRMNSTSSTPPVRDFPINEAQRIRWSPDGNFLLIIAPRGVIMRDWRLNSTTMLVSDAFRPPDAVFSPDSSRVAFTNGGRNNVQVPQIYVVERSGGNAVQYTAHTAATISNLAWLPD
jgi:Tol biopolymer transport system component